MAFLLARVKELEDKEDSETEDEESHYPGSTKENAAEVEEEGPIYKDGMLSPMFWESHWNIFRQCSACNEFKYVNRSHTLRSVGCRNCMGENCRASKASRKVNLLKQLKKVHGEKIYENYLVQP